MFPAVNDFTANYQSVRVVLHGWYYKLQNLCLRIQHLNGNNKKQNYKMDGCIYLESFQTIKGSHCSCIYHHNIFLKKK